MGRSAQIREAEVADYSALGDLTVAANLALDGMPTLEEGRPYYDDLRDVASRARKDANVIVAAFDPSSGVLLGGVTFVREGYGRPWSIDCAGVRMLGVAAAAQGRGVGEALVRDVLDRARAAGKGVVLLHTSQVMRGAQRLYERLGFRRETAIDTRFMETDLMGYRLDLD